MDTYSVVNRLEHFFRLLWASFLALFNFCSRKTANSSDIETGVLQTASKDMEISYLPSEVIEIRPPNSMTMAEYESNQPLSRDVPERRFSRMHPVKSRILDATLKNVRDKRFSVVKTVIIRRCSVLHLPCSAKVEFLPNAIVSGLAPFNSALKVLESSRKRVVQFVLTPTFLPDIASATTFHPCIDNSSIEDLFDLFPSPPAYLPPLIPALTEIVDCTDNPTLIQTPSSPSEGNKRHSLFLSSANVLLATGASVSSDHTASTLTLKTPEHSQVAYFCSDAAAGIGGTPMQVLPDQIAKCRVSSLSVLPAPHERKTYSVIGNVCRIEESMKSVSCSPVIDQSSSLNLSGRSDFLAGEEHDIVNVLTGLYSHLSGNNSQSTCVSFAKSIPELTPDTVLDRTNLTEMEQSIFPSLEVDPSISPFTKTSVDSSLSDGKHADWRQSMEELPQAFRDVNLEDQDLKGLFYRDSPHPSRSSRASLNPSPAKDGILNACSALDLINLGSSVEELRFRDGDSATSSSESIFEDGLFTPNSIVASSMEVVGLSSSIFGVHDLPDRVGLGVRHLIQVDTPKTTSASQHRLSILTKWFSGSQTRRTNDGSGMESSTSASFDSDEGTHDLWSELLELNAY